MTSSFSLDFSSSYISKVFIKTEMLLKSKSVLTGPKQLTRSRSSDNLPTSQSQLNIQMMSHTLTIREVSTFVFTFNLQFYDVVFFYFCSTIGCSKLVFKFYCYQTSAVSQTNKLYATGFKKLYFSLPNPFLVFPTHFVKLFRTSLGQCQVEEKF